MALTFERKRSLPPVTFGVQDRRQAFRIGSGGFAADT
jgi:hypothetical protein